jgi:hypothetical protein
MAARKDVRTADGPGARGGIEARLAQSGGVLEGMAKGIIRVPFLAGHFVFPNIPLYGTEMSCTWNIMG